MERIVRRFLICVDLHDPRHPRAIPTAGDVCLREGLGLTSDHH